MRLLSSSSGITFDLLLSRSAENKSYQYERIGGAKMNNKGTYVIQSGMDGRIQNGTTQVKLNLTYRSSELKHDTLRKYKHAKPANKNADRGGTVV